MKGKLIIYRCAKMQHLRCFNHKIKNLLKSKIKHKKLPKTVKTRLYILRHQIFFRKKLPRNPRNNLTKFQVNRCLTYVEQSCRKDNKVFFFKSVSPGSTPRNLFSSKPPQEPLKQSDYPLPPTGTTSKTFKPSNHICLKLETKRHFS